MITLKLPNTIGESDHIFIQTADGKALSPRFFNTQVTSPNTAYQQEIALGAINLSPRGLAFSVNGRRVFVANANEGSVSMINVERAEEWTSTVFTDSGSVLQVFAVAVGPAGRKVYVAGEDAIGVVHAHTLALLKTIPVNSGGIANNNSQGIAVSPDGRWLMVSDATDDGSVSLIDIENQYAIKHSFTVGGGNMPRGIAINPNNTVAYIAVSGIDNEIWVYEFASENVISRIPLGTSPAAIAVAPDASRLYVTNAPADTVNYYDLGTGFSAEIDLGFGIAPFGISISPDGQKIYVTGKMNQVYVIDYVTDLVEPVNVGGATLGITISPDGKRAYTSLANGGKLVEIGGQRNLKISKQGGIGTVTTSRGGVNCGSTCNAGFDVGEVVSLYASADHASNTTFDRWGGDPDCADGLVTMTDNRYCVAHFQVYNPPPESTGSGSNNCFIATAAYGSWLDPHVMTLRKFRDDYLLTNAMGTWFVEFYYANSPPIADYIREREALKFTVRVLLTPVVYAIEYPLAACLIVLAILVSRRQRRIGRQKAMV